MTVQDGWYLVWPEEKPKMIVAMQGGGIEMIVPQSAWEKASEAGLITQELIDAATAVQVDTPEIPEDEQRHTAKAWNCDADENDVIVVRL